MINEQFADYWDFTAGAAFIPWAEIPEDVEPLTDEGFFIDAESLPENLKGKLGSVTQKGPKCSEPLSYQKEDDGRALYGSTLSLV